MQETNVMNLKPGLELPCTTYRQNMEQVYSYNPGAQHAAFTK